MYQITVVLTEDRKKGRLYKEKTIEGPDREELQKQVLPVIEELAGADDFISPIAEYFIERDGLYLDGEVDIKVKINRNGVNAKLGGLLI